MLRFVGMVALCCWFALGVAAQAGRQASDNEAKALFQAGQAAFSEGRYARAHEHFQAAYDASRRPELLYNIALSADRARMDEAALRAYREFIAALPDHPQRAFAEIGWRS